MRKKRNYIICFVLKPKGFKDSRARLKIHELNFTQVSFTHMMLFGFLLFLYRVTKHFLCPQLLSPTENCCCSA